MSKETARQIDEQALAWHVRRETGPWSNADQEKLAEWLRADTLHRVTYLRLKVGWERTSRLKTFGVGRPSGIVPPPGEWRSSPFFERRPAPVVRFGFKRSAPRIATVAAGVLLALGAGFYFKKLFTDKVYETPIGAITSIPLSDGSRVTLNTASKLRVSLNETERRIELETGEAFFDVAKDSARPFIVHAGERKIVAVGTRFSVRRDGSDVQVVVTEGKVRVDPAMEGGIAEILTAGSTVRTESQKLIVQKKSVPEAERALSWRDGYLTFDQTLLADAVAEFNRYSKQRIVIDDPQLAALKISGKFRSAYSEDFVHLLHNSSGIRVRRTDDTIHLASH